MPAKPRAAAQPELPQLYAMLTLIETARCCMQVAVANFPSFLVGTFPSGECWYLWLLYLLSYPDCCETLLHSWGLLMGSGSRYMQWQTDGDADASLHFPFNGLPGEEHRHQEVLQAGAEQAVPKGRKPWRGPAACLAELDSPSDNYILQQ